MNNFEKGTVEYISEMLPKENCTHKEFKKAMASIHKVTEQWAPKSKKVVLPKVDPRKVKLLNEGIDPK